MAWRIDVGVVLKRSSFVALGRRFLFLFAQPCLVLSRVVPLLGIPQHLWLGSSTFPLVYAVTQFVVCLQPISHFLRRGRGLLYTPYGPTSFIFAG